jgi:hypothetical protein
LNPGDLLAPPSPLGAPAPYALLVALKVLGFTLHALPMSLWYTGLPVALVLHARGSGPAREWAARLLLQMPLFVALGVNFGIVPLLFLQTTAYRVFYPATILMAWPWLAVVPLLTLAYYGVYAYVVGLKRGRLAGWQRAAGWTASILFIAIGFLFTHAMSLMTRVDAWPEIWRRTSAAGAVTGMGSNVNDPTLWPRWLLFIGLALTTTAVHAVVDRGILAPQASADARRWAGRFALRLYFVGAAWFAAAGTWYVFGTWRPAIRDLMLAGPLLPLTVLTAVGPGVVWLLILAQRRGVTRGLAWATAAAQLAVVALNAVSRQIVQNAELRPWLDVAAEPARTQWSPLVLFLLLFAGGVGVLVWIVRQLVAAERGARAAPGPGPRTA